MAREQIPEKFIFYVEKEDTYDWDGEWDEVPQDYVVSMPHQCDNWHIVSTQDREHAIERVEEFIRAALDALQRLKELP